MTSFPSAGGFFHIVESILSTHEKSTDSFERLDSIVKGAERTVTTVSPATLIRLAEEHRTHYKGDVGGALWAYDRYTGEMIDINQTGSPRSSYGYDNRKRKNISLMTARAAGAREDARLALEKRREAKGGK